MSGELSYVEALFGLCAPDEIDAVIEVIDHHKNWGSFRARNVPSHLLVNLVEEVKRLRTAAGGYKKLPDGIEVRTLPPRAVPPNAGP